MKNEEIRNKGSNRGSALIPMSANIGLRLGESDEEMKTGNEEKQHCGGFRRETLIQRSAVFLN